MDIQLIPSPEHEEVAAHTLVSTLFDGVYPKRHLVQFLPAKTRRAGAVDRDHPDPRVPLDPRVLPCRIVHTRDERGENFVVQYPKKVACRDGVQRKTIWYRCRTRAIAPGSEEHAEGHRRAEAAAWYHVEQVLNAGEDADSVDLRFGSGELRGTGRIKHHGDPYEDFVFHVHPRKP